MVIIWLIIQLCGFTPQPVLYTITGRAQGTTYSIKYVSTEAVVSKASIDSIFHVIDLSLSLYEPGSLICGFNREGVIRMDEHMGNVVRASLEINRVSSGGFDITTRPMSLLWGFGTNGAHSIPAPKEIRRVQNLAGSGNLSIRNDSLFANKKGVQIDCNGIAQGYTVDVISGYLENKGLHDHLVEVGGEVRASGKNQDGHSWQVGIESPSAIAGDWYPVKKVIALDDLSVTTSGSYRNYFQDKGRTYSHVLDPHSGKPVSNGIISVTVVCKDAMAADAWDNGFFVMGTEASFKKLSELNGVELYIIYTDRQGNIRDTASKGFLSLLR